MQTTARVFISYARSDGELFAGKLRRRIEVEQPEITVWQDRAQMEGGIGWWKQITTALDAVDYLILVMTPAALNSEISRKEWRYARQAGVCVYPVKGAPDSELDFNAVPLWMRQAHFFDIDREWDTFVRYLKSPCQTDRVPFMAPDLPAGYIPRADFTRRVLDTILDSERQEPKPGTTVLYGAGGLGKTTGAAGVCHHEDVITAFPDGILWATLGENPSTIAGLTEIFAALTGDRPKFVSDEDAANEVSRRLENRHYLIVIDDVWTPAQVQPFLRGGSECVRLITTRQFEIATEFTSAGRRIRMPQMECDEAVGMLLASLETEPADVTPFRTLAERLAQWPLMLKLARGAITQRLARGDSMSGALRKINQALDLKGFTVFDSRDANERHGGLSKTIQVSLDLLEPADQEHCFELAIFPGDIDIPLEIAALLWGQDAFGTEHLAERLDGVSLLEFDLKKGSLRLHDLMRDYFRRRLAVEALVHQRLIDAWGDLKALSSSYAWRWCVFHLTRAGKNDAAMRLLTDFDWLQAKLENSGSNALINDYDYVRQSQELGLVQASIRLAAHAVTSDTSEFAGQLLGRLTGDSAEVKAVQNGARAYSSHIWLRPVCASLTRPGGPILRLLTGHEGPIRDVAVSRDGRKVASASSVKCEVRIWDVKTWSELQVLGGHESAVNGVDISADGMVVLSGSDDHTAKVWNADTGKELLTLRGHTAAVRAVALARTARRAVTGSFDRSVRVWDIETGLPLHTLLGHEDWIRAVVISNNGRLVVSGSMDGTFRVWDAVAGVELRVLRIHQQPARSLVWLKQGSRLLSGADDGSIKAWNLDGSNVQTLCESDASIQSISASADGRRTVSLSGHKLCVWDIETCRCVRTLEAPAGNINTVAIAPDGVWAVTGSQDETLRVWNLESSNVGPGVHGHGDWVNAVAITHDSRRAVSGAYDGTLKVWDPTTGDEVYSLTLDGGAVRAVAVSGGMMISGSERGAFRVWDVATGALLSASSAAAAINSVAMDAGGKRAVSGSPDGVLRIWEVGNSTPLYTIRAHPSSILAVAINSEGTLALSASSDATVRCWDVNSGREVQLLRGHEDFVRCVSVAPDCARAISGSNRGRLKIWDLSSASELLDIESDIGTVNGVALMAGGHGAISGSGDRTVRLWDLNAARIVASFTADDTVTSCAIASDRRTIVAGDASGAVHFLRIEKPPGAFGNAP